ncbi:hypothetical protein CCHR01_14207 [Colletotrichum chrysophilum]|uniref:Uncharacterized protein n=1 Tax=Colletotrichum chrysophilum TaxID=1836956 RepID=A0AAD9A908_9PEZI|nr:hypothetical protein CCHR01_14207 [Colletotrichum chrysophilum]
MLCTALLCSNNTRMQVQLRKQMQMRMQVQANVAVVSLLPGLGSCCCCCFCFLLLLRQVLPFRSYLAPFHAFHTSPSMSSSPCVAPVSLSRCCPHRTLSLNPPRLPDRVPASRSSHSHSHSHSYTKPYGTFGGGLFFCTASLPQRPFPPSHSQKKFPLAAFPFSSSQRWPFTFSFSHPSFLFLRKIHQARNSDLTSVNHLLPANNSPPYSNLCLSTTTHPHRRHPSSGDTSADHQAHAKIQHPSSCPSSSSAALHGTLRKTPSDRNSRSSVLSKKLWLSRTATLAAAVGSASCDTLRREMLRRPLPP